MPCKHLAALRKDLAPATRAKPPEPRCREGPGAVDDGVTHAERSVKLVGSYTKQTHAAIMRRASQAHPLKRVPLLLPPEMVAWIDLKTKHVENRTTFIRRLIAKAMQEDVNQK